MVWKIVVVVMLLGIAFGCASKQSLDAKASEASRKVCQQGMSKCTK